MHPWLSAGGELISFVSNFYLGGVIATLSCFYSLAYMKDEKIGDLLAVLIWSAMWPVIVATAVFIHHSERYDNARRADRADKGGREGETA